MYNPLTNTIMSAPWPQHIADNINEWQRRKDIHPFTCGTEGCDGVLTATEEGLECPVCKIYTQQWAWDYMGLGSKTLLG